MRSARVAASFTVLLAWTTPASAQRAPLPEGESSWCEVRANSDGGVAACTKWGPRTPKGRTSTVRLHWLDNDFRNTGQSTTVHQGESMLISLATLPGTACVTLLHGGAAPHVVVVLAQRNGAAPQRIDALRTAGAAFSPTNSATCARPGGFAVIWQERSHRDPSDVRTFFGQLNLQGQWTRTPAQVSVPWGFGAMAWNGKGYHLALFYDGAAYGQTRLSMVTLSEVGQPEQHPWWISRPETVGDPQLYPTQRGVMAVWRGGADEASLHSTLVNGVRQWGTEAEAPRSHGTVTDRQVFAVKPRPDGTQEVVVRNAPE